MAKEDSVYLVSSGDLCLTADRLCRPRRWSITTLQRPMVRIVIPSVRSDQMMVPHKANGVRVTDIGNAQEADAFAARGCCLYRLGIEASVGGAAHP